MGADSSDIYRSLEQRVDNVMILGRVLKTEPKSKQKTGTGIRGFGGAAECVGVQRSFHGRCSGVNDNEQSLTNTSRSYWISLCMQSVFGRKLCGNDCKSGLHTKRAFSPCWN